MLSLFRGGNNSFVFITVLKAGFKKEPGLITNTIFRLYVSYSDLNNHSN